MRVEEGWAIVKERGHLIRKKMPNFFEGENKTIEDLEERRKEVISTRGPPVPA